MVRHNVFFWLDDSLTGEQKEQFENEYQKVKTMMQKQVSDNFDSKTFIRKHEELYLNMINN